MTQEEARTLLEAFKSGTLTETDALSQLQAASFAELGYAKVDLVRKERQGFPEVILGSGKTPQQIIGITQSLKDAGQAVLVTRVDAEKAIEVTKAFPSGDYYPEARCFTLVETSAPKRQGTIAIASGGTSDLPIAEEAAVTAEFMGNHVLRIYDVGVACLSRVLHRLEDLRMANVIIVIAGMEGALPSVIAGLVDKPIIAVPTSIGYGANLGGIAALLGMLNSCGSGVTVVNIDNGFGASFAANQINRLANQFQTENDK